MQKHKKIFVTGGHVTPALATIELLEKKGIADIVFIGRKYAKEGDRNVSIEYQLITDRHIPFLTLTAGRIQRSLTRHTFGSLSKIPIGFIQAFWYCLKHRPRLVVSFGGYIALPVSLAAYMLRIPIITHEQTLVPGLANKIIARLARRVCVTYEETLSLFPKGTSVHTGLPIRRELFATTDTRPYDADTKSYPLMYITGGATGAASLNRLCYPIIKDLTDRYTVIHQVGSTIMEALTVKSTLPKAQQKRYIPESYIPVDTLSWILARVALVIGRSGANTVIELAASGCVALLVPLPWSAGGEQEKNAKWLARHGGAVVISQEDLTSNRLLREIESIQKKQHIFKQKAEAFAPEVPKDGALKFVRHIESLL